MRTVLTLALLFGLGSLPALADDSGADPEAPLVKDGLLGTVNVLRELDVKTGKNRVMIEGDYKFSTDWGGGPVESTIDGSGLSYLPATDPKHWVVTYKLPGPRTVLSLVIAYDGRNYTAPDTVLLEGSADGGKTWFVVFKSKLWNKDFFLKCFKPAKVNALRLTQEGGNPRTREVLVYADPEVPLPLFGGKDTGVFDFLRDLYYHNKIGEFPSPQSAVWAQPWGGLPQDPFASFITHEGTWGMGHGTGQRLYLRLDLDKAYPMTFGLISCPNSGDDQTKYNLAGQCRAEFYTANGKLDPAKLTGSSSKDLAGQGWVLQKTWDKDGDPCKRFLLAHPGKYNQILLTWECQAYEVRNNWTRLEMFGVEEPDAGVAPRNPQT